VSSDAGPEPGLPRWRQDWGEPVREAALDPQRRIIDPHHHLWPWREATPMSPAGPYLGPELLKDARGGHNVVATVAIECGVAYRPELGPDLASAGETAFVAAEARALERACAGLRVAGFVAHIDLRSGDDVRRRIAAHRKAGGRLLKGVRQMAAWAPDAPINISPIAGDLYADPGFRAGVRAAAAEGLVIDVWHYHTQGEDFAALARACPEAVFVVDHYGTPLGVGPYAGRKEQVFAEWARGIELAAACPNVLFKASGFALAMTGADFIARPAQPASEDVAAWAEPYFSHLLKVAGAERCMFASNFPIEKTCVAYGVLYNAFKRLAQALPEADADSLFFEVAKSTYRLALDSVDAAPRPGLA